MPAQIKLDTARITQDRRTISEKELESCSNLVLLLDPDTDPARLPYGKAIRQRLADARHKLAPDAPYHTQLPNLTGTRASLLVADAARSPFELLTTARKIMATHRRPASGQITIVSFCRDPAAAERCCEALIAAALAADFPMPHFKSESKPVRRLKQLRIHGVVARHGYARTLAEAQGNNLARYLTSLPPNELTPRLYRQQVTRLARQQRWKMEFLDSRKLARLGAGAFLAVAQGSPEADAGIVHLRYVPKKKTRRPGIALVGKGICFDTGGTNLKPAKYMHGMHEDMEGSAVALGTLLALTALQVDYPVDCWLALAQNHIGPKAYKQNDVVKAANGTTIEVMHTDAEGRMVLADTLTLATRARPSLLLDFATLTGACVGALSTRMSGAITNRLELVPAIIDAGLASGERVWPFPLEPDYDQALKSEVADIRQCTLDSDADHILAASFLKRFIEHNVHWVHVDLSAGNHKGGLAHIPTDVTGFGVRFALELLARRNSRESL